MLYNPKWEKRTDKSFGGVSLFSLIAWLETKSENETYCYAQPFDCAAAQYLRAIGVPEDKSYVNFGHFVGRGKKSTECDWLYQIVGNYPNTFGAALKRARALLAFPPDKGE